MRRAAPWVDPRVDVQSPARPVVAPGPQGRPCVAHAAQPHVRTQARAVARGKRRVTSCRSDAPRPLRGATPAQGAPAPGAGQRQVGRRDDGARGAPTRQRSLDPAQPDEHAAQRRVECHTMLLSRHPHHRSRCCGVGTCSVSTAVRLEASPRRSYRWVVVTLACPASCCTVEISTWASSKSLVHLQNRRQDVLPPPRRRGLTRPDADHGDRDGSAARAVRPRRTRAAPAPAAGAGPAV